MTQRILLAGMSGTGTRSIGDKLCKYLNRGSRDVAISSNFEELWIETALPKIDFPKWKKDAFLESRNYYLELFLKTLELNTKAFRDTYNRTWDSGMMFHREIEERPVYHLISCHISLYPSNDPIPIKVLNEDHILRHKITSIILFIDDIYDVYFRLKEKNYFDEPKNTEQLIEYLKRVLRWREYELSYAYSIAENCEIPCYQIAVKHPIATIAKVIASDLPSIYLSHPISQLRNTGLERKSVAKFFKGFDSLTNELRKNYILYEPTTIDELRFNTPYPYWYRPKHGIKKKQFLSIPKLTTRWKANDPAIREVDFLPQANQIERDFFAVKMNNGSDRRAEETLKQFFKKRRPNPNHVLEMFLEWAAEASLDKQLIEKIVSWLKPDVKSLKESISSQLTSRDASLVLQGQHIFLFRPYFNGTESGGMKRELEIFLDQPHFLDFNGGVAFRYMPLLDSIKTLKDRFPRIVKENKHKLFDLEVSLDQMKRNVSVRSEQLIELVQMYAKSGMAAINPKLRVMLRNLGISVTAEPSLVIGGPVTFPTINHGVRSVFDELIPIVTHDSRNVTRTYDLSNPKPEEPELGKVLCQNVSALLESNLSSKNLTKEPD